MKIKVLKYDCKPFHMWSLEDIHGKNNIKYIIPVFNREGWYYDRKAKFSWYEFVDKKGDIIAYTTVSALYKTFEFKLKLLNHIPLSIKERKAINTLRKYAGKELRELAYTDDSWNATRNTGRSARKQFNKCFKDV